VNRSEVDFDRHLKPFVFFVSRICHDLNNMITGSLGAVTLLEFKLNNYPELDLNTEIKRMYTAVTKFDDLSKKLETIFLRPDDQKIPFDIDRVIRATVGKLDNRDHPIDYRGEPIMMQLHVDGVSYLVDELVKNARESMVDGGKVMMRLQRDGGNGQALLSVEDNGKGISAQQLQDIFVPFRSYSKRGNLVGLGLTMAASVAFDHGGGLAIESTPGVGTRAEVRLALDSP